MLKKWPILVMTLAMAGVANAAYSGTPATPKTDTDGCYEIGTAEELYGFAAIVNGTDGHTAEPAACGKLDANITVNENVLTSAGELNTASAGGFIEWTPIGNSNNKFQGAFNGQGHTISGLYFNNPETDNVGLFGYTFGAVTIDNVGLVDSYFLGKNYVGSVVGYAMASGTKRLSLKNSYNTGVVNGTDYVGGLVGGNLSNQSFYVENSYNSGAVNGSKNVGGLVGNSGEIKFSYNVGLVTGTTYVGGLAGMCNSIADSYNAGLVEIGGNPGNAMMGYGCDLANVSSKISNSYYLEGSGNSCGPSSFSGTTEEFANGLVAIKLHQFDTKNIGNGSVWGQVVGTDKTPTLTGEIKFRLNEGCFEIANEEDLYLFAAVVNTEFDPDACGKLTADIKVNENVLGTGNANIDATTGAYTGSTTGLRKWTPIGNSDHPFIGTFDGDGHTISGLYFNDDAEKYVGLFGYVESSESVDVSIKNVGLEDSYFKAGGNVGGIVGFVGDNVDVKIENVYNAAAVTDGGGGYVGGIVGEFWTYEPSTLNILNSYNSGAVFGINSVGGLVGDVDDRISASTVSIKNSYNYGAVTVFNNQGETLVGSVAGTSVNISDTYYLENSNLQSTHGGTEMSSTQFADGTVYAALHSAKDGDVWFQKPGDKFPTLSQEKNGPVTHEVVLNYPKAGSSLEYDPETILYVEGFVKSLPTIDKEGYPILGWYTSGHENSPITEIPATSTSDMTLFPKLFVPFVNGCYEIATAEQLYWFAATVNKGNVNACGKLTANIEVNQNVLATADGVSKVNADGSYDTASGEPEKIWTPIGNETNPFQGTFDGQGYTISGLYFNGEKVYDVGLFGRVAGDADGASVANVNVADSYFGDKGETGDHVGGVVGMVTHGGVVNVKNVSSAAVVVGNDDVGGVVGYVLGTEGDLELNIANAYNVGMVKGSDGVGGLVGDVTIDRAENKIAINNSYNYGDVSFKMSDGGAPLIGKVVNNGSLATIAVDNSYYLANESSGSYGENKTRTEFADGTVLTALRSGEGGYVWVQNPGDKYPTIDINASKNAKTIVLNWTSAADSTTLADVGYTAGAMVIVKSGKQFYAGGAIYEGILSADQVKAIGSNKLYPISGVELATDGNGFTTATLNGKDDARTTVMIPTNVEVDRVIYKRNITANTYMTIMLPFDVTVSPNMGYTFYKFCGVGSDTEGTIINVAPVTTKFKANRPYIMIANADNSEGITFEKVGDSKYTLNTTTSSTDVTADNWTMRGVYEYKVWPEGDRDLGYVYGFASKAGLGNQIGEFVEAGAGADIVPMRMYLKETKPQSVRGNGKYNYSSHTGPAKVVRVQIVEGDGDDETTAIKHVATVPTVVKSNRWFDVKGRALNGKPTAKGTYYYNGQRVIIK